MVSCTCSIGQARSGLSSIPHEAIWRPIDVPPTHWLVEKYPYMNNQQVSRVIIVTILLHNVTHYRSWINIDHGWLKLEVYFQELTSLFGAGLVCAPCAPAMDLLDVDGDCIQFLIDPKGRLREILGISEPGPEKSTPKWETVTSGNLKEL